MKNIQIIIVCTTGLLPIAAAFGNQRGQETTAVIALSSDKAQVDTKKVAEHIQRNLSARMEVASVGDVKASLGGVGLLDGDIDYLRGIYQQGYLESYSFKYQRAIENLKKVIEGLERVPDGKGRWDLFVNAYIYLGKARQGKKDTKGAIQAFHAVLRTRPTMKLSLKEHSPTTLRLWNEAWESLKALPTGKLSIDTDTKGASIFLDGVEVGKTPFVGKFPYGRYHMKIRHEDTGSMARWIEIHKKEIQKRYKLLFECAIDTSLGHPAIRIPKGRKTVPNHWWSWIGSRLDVQRIVVVQKKVVNNRTRWVASLVDAQPGRVVREGWVEASGPTPEHMAVDAYDLADFLVTGQAKKRVIKTIPPPKKTPAPKKTAQAPLPKQQMVTQEIPTQPWYCKWWPYALMGGLVLGGGVGAQLASNQYDETTGTKEEQEASDTWQMVAIGGYVLAGALVLTGFILELTYKDPEPTTTTHALVPTAGSGGVGVSWVHRF